MKDFEPSAQNIGETESYDANSLWANHYETVRKARACSEGFLPTEQFRSWVNDQFSTMKKPLDLIRLNSQKDAVGAFVWDYAQLGVHKYVGDEVKLEDSSFQLELIGGFDDARAEVSFAYSGAGELCDFKASFYSKGRDEGDVLVTTAGMKMDQTDENARIKYSTKELTRDARLAFNTPLFLKIEDIFGESERALKLGERNYPSLAHAHYTDWLESQAGAFAGLLVGNRLIYDRKLEAYFDDSKTSEIDRQRGEPGFIYDRKAGVYRKDSYGILYELKFDGGKRKHLTELKVKRKSQQHMRESGGAVELTFKFTPD